MTNLQSSTNPLMQEKVQEGQTLRTSLHVSEQDEPWQEQGNPSAMDCHIQSHVYHSRSLGFLVSHKPWT
jgi:hypothetical protein